MSPAGVLGLVLLDGRLEDVVIAVRAEHLAEESDTAAVSLGSSPSLFTASMTPLSGEREAEADGLVHRRISNDILGLELVEEVSSAGSMGSPVSGSISRLGAQYSSLRATAVATFLGSAAISGGPRV